MDPRAGSRVSRAALALLAAALLAGCGTAADVSGPGKPSGGAIALNSLQRQIEIGGRLFFSEGCAACHVIGGPQRDGPNFGAFAGHEVKLAGGGDAYVDEAFVKRALSDPTAPALAGWPSGPMRAALLAAHLNSSPAKVAALAAFIEQVGPEG